MPNAQTAPDMTITRIFDAPRELVWKAWSDPEHLRRWWGPEHFTAPTCKVDFRVGGTYHFCMRSPEGQDFWSTGQYQEITPIERIVFTDSFADEFGNVVAPTYYGMGDDFPSELVVTVTFEALAGKTRMTMHHAGIPAGEHREAAQLGWNQSFDKLAASLAS